MAWKPTDQDHMDVMLAMNPWHSESRVPTALAMERRRPLAEALWQSLLGPVLSRFQLVIGPRRVGKTVAMYQTVQQLLDRGIEPDRLWWLHLAHPLLMERSLGKHVGAVRVNTGATRERPVFLFLDELTYAQNWDVWLKTFYDEQWPIRVVGTSSSTAALREGRLESGVGRWAEQYLAPCLFTEYLHLRGKSVGLSVRGTLAETIEVNVKQARITSEVSDERGRYLLIGGFPELLMAESSERPQSDIADELLRSQKVLRDDAVQKAVYQDIPQVFGVQNPLSLERLLYVLAGQIGGLISPTSLANSIGLADVTIETYMSYLERSYVIFLLQNFAPREETRQRRGRKVYFVDGAVRSAALQLSLASLRAPGEMSILIENAVASHLHALSRQDGTRLYHWRHRESEVDFVYDHPERPLAFEAASSARHSTKALAAFQGKFGRFRGGCYLVYPGASPGPADSSGRIGRLPLEFFLMAAGGQAEREQLQRLTT